MVAKAKVKAVGYDTQGHWCDVNVGHADFGDVDGTRKSRSQAEEQSNRREEKHSQTHSERLYGQL